MIVTCCIISVLQSYVSAWISCRNIALKHGYDAVCNDQKLQPIKKEKNEYVIVAQCIVDCGL